MTLSSLDSKRMAEAMVLAETAVGVSEPNPRVGCVIARGDGQTLGEGATQAVGGPHAEVMALRHAAAHGHDVHGATAWVTLEPCAHHGRTPPCCDALLAAGLKRVVVACEDPFSGVAGAGIARLRAAGVVVDMAEQNAAAAARELNIGFFSRMLRHRPWVRMKVAVSLDGRTALPDGRSQWITGPVARADGHAWRKRAGAVLTGLGTVLADDPRLDVRLVNTQVQPLRWVLDSKLRCPPQAQILSAPGRTVLVNTVSSSEHSPALQAAGAELLTLLPTAAGQVNLQALMEALTQRQVNELHVEAGPRLNASLLAGGWVDELLVYQAPLLIGPGREMAALGALAALQAAPRFAYREVSRVGADLRLVLRKTGKTPFDSLFECNSGPAT
jgi:diaminohydroxyphosphoribosylaminopyrimidine deaminase / 5-amino-6-(5-phosphoribosylamino)uracil reductase